MNNLQWKYIKPLENRNSVKDFLQKYNVNLPKELIEILKCNNGGRPASKIFNTDKYKGYVFKSLLSYNTTDKETIYMVYPGKFRERSLYPIGADAAGNFICYHCLKECYILYNHEKNSIEKIVQIDENLSI